MYTVSIDEPKRRVVTTWGPQVGDASLMRYQETVWRDPDVRGFDEVIDFRALEQIEVTTDGLAAVAQMAAAMDAQVGESRFAIVAGSDLGFGLSRMYEAFREMNASATRKVMVFHCMEAALAWLDQRRNA